MSSIEEAEIVSKLKGNTLRTYWALLSSEDGVVGVRELQRELGFSSPALAAYHLNKLVDFNLAVNERGGLQTGERSEGGGVETIHQAGIVSFPSLRVVCLHVYDLLSLYINPIQRGVVL